MINNPQTIWFKSIVFAIAITIAGSIGVMFSAQWKRSAKGIQSEPNRFLPSGVPDLGWPTIRGPLLNGHSPEIHLADGWPVDGPPLLWRRNLGQGYSSFVAARDCVITQYQTLAGQFVLCLNASDGTTIWQHRYDDAYELTGMYPGPRSTPTIDEGHIFFTSPDAVVGCLDWNGKQLWAVDLKERFGSRGTEFGYSCSPLVVDGKVLLPLGGDNAAMVALSKNSGAILWHTGNDSASYASAFPMTVGNQQIVIGLMQHTLCGFDLDSGSQLFRVKLSRGYDEHSTWPIARDDLLWIASPFQAGSTLYRVTPEQSNWIELINECDTMSNDVVSSVLVENHVYGFDLAESQSKANRPSRGSFRCVDFMTGKIAWTNGDEKIRRTADYAANKASRTVGHAAVIVADEKLILLNDTGDLIIAAATPDRYIELGRTPLLNGKIGWATPALDRGRLFVRNHSVAVCVHLGDPERIDAGVLSKSRGANQVHQSNASFDRTWIGNRPEDTVRSPTSHELTIWFFTTAATMLLGALLAAAFHHLTRHRLNLGWRFHFVPFAYLLCAVTGPLLSRLTDTFIFTWPGCLVLAFDSTIGVADFRRGTESGTLGRVIAVAFLATCGIYFLVCRQHNLVSQWIFLVGFAAVIPTSLARRYFNRRNGPLYRCYEACCFAASLAAFFLVAAAVLQWQYGHL